MRKKILIGTSILIVFMYILVVTFGPPIVDKTFNVVSTEAVINSVSNKASSIHEQLVITDMHADSLLFDRNLLKEEEYGHVDIPRLIKGNVALQFFMVVTKVPMDKNIDGTDEDSIDQITLLAIVQGWDPKTYNSILQRAIYQANKLYHFEEESNGVFTVIQSSKDLKEYLKIRKITPDITAGILGLEGAHALEGDLAKLDVLYDKGYRVIGPTHFHDNELGGSAQGVSKEGLTEFGESVIKRMEDLNMTIDLAHASPEMIDDILTMANKPVIVSHTGVKGTVDNNRNLSDEQIIRIAKNGGVIGIGYWDTAIGELSADSIVEAIDYVVKLVGIDYVGLGSDFDGTTTVPFDTTGIVEITDALIDNGYSKSEIEKIMGGNINRVLMNNLPSE